MSRRYPPLLRSLMFVPGHRPRMIDRALGVGEFAATALDVAILDLEDGVPLAEKEHARATVVTALGREGGAPARYVRVNASPDQRAADLAAVVCRGLDGVVAPKVASAEEMMAIAHSVAEREITAGLERGSVKIIASIESARGLL